LTSKPIVPSARRLLAASKRQAKSLLRPLVANWNGAPKTFSPERWGLSSEPNGLSLRGVSLHALLDQWGSPLFVVDEERLRANAVAFQSVPTGRTSGCEVYYSYKTNPVVGVLRALHAWGVGAEVISPYELWLARRLGVPPARIIYNGPGKSDESIREAIELGIGSINCNHAEEVERIARLARQAGRRARIGIRVAANAGWSAQFGTPIRDGLALAAFERALAFPELEVVSIHAHRGGMIRWESELTSFVSEVLDFVEELRAKLGLRLELLNFGGSLGLPTVCGLDGRDRQLNQTFHRDLPLPVAAGTLSIERYVEVLVGLVHDHHQRVSEPVPRIAVEPGRSMTGNTQLLLAKVLTTKTMDGVRFAVLDAGINLAESVRNEYHQVLPINRFGEPATQVHTLVGPICSPGDTLYSAVRLPTLNVGDSLAVLDAGAYFVPFSTSFSYPRPAIVMVRGSGAVQRLRLAETFEDLTRLETDEGA